MYRVKTMFKLKTVIALMIITLLAASSGAQTKVVTKSMAVNPEDLFLLQELGAVITGGEKGLEIMMIAPAENRGDDYKIVDVQTGDIIKMANGKSIKSAKDLQNIYDSLKIGDEIKLGLSREKQMVIAALKKGDPAKMPTRMQTKVMSGSGGCPASQPQVVKSCGGGNVNSTLIDVGVLILAIESENKIAVEDVIDHPEKAFTGIKPAKGDHITAIQGKQVTSVKELEESFNKIESGREVKLEWVHDGKTTTTTYVKP